MAELPAGTVTFLFTDIEGSTRLLHELGDRYAEVLIDHRGLLRKAFGEFSGREVETQGDSFFVAFQDAGDAILAAAAAQRALAAHPWPGGRDVRVRMGIHTGEPLIRAGDYVGIDVHRAARIAAAAWGGQVLLSARTSALVQKNGAMTDCTFREMGAFALKDLPEPERLFQLVLDDLPASFPPPRVAEKAPAAAGLPDYSLPPADVPCPYKGLVRFESEDSDLFFGREELVSALVARLDEAAFLAVVGPSGSGKSSLVRAGVVPELLRRQELLRTAIIEPGEHPLANLDGTRDADLVVVDQFEEVFTLCRDEAERHAFVELLLDTAQRNVRVIVIVRADFYGHCAAYVRLAAALEDRQALIGSMTEEELRRAIDRPAERAGLVLEPGLAEGILRDVVGEPGALPLLSHSLLETWRRRSDRMLTLLGYLQAGGVRGAIAKTAETVFQSSLTPKQQTLARSIFLRLTEEGEGTEDTRRRVRLDELTPRREDAADVAEVMRVLAEARLVMIGEGTVEVAHEALIRHWPTLRAWLGEDREGRLIHRHLTEAAHEWERLSRDRDALYRGTRLATAADWAELHDGELNELEHEFLTASRQAELGEFEATKRRNRRLRILVAALAVFLVGVLLAGTYAFVTRSQSISREKRARSLALASASNDLLSTHLDASLLLSLEAERARETTQAKGSMIRALDAFRHLGARTLLRQGSAPVLGVAFSPDGSTLAAAGNDGKVVLWDAAHAYAKPTALDSGQTGVYRRWPAAPPDRVAFSPDGSTLAAPSADGRVLLWDAAHAYAKPTALDSGQSGVNGVAFSPDGSTLAAAGNDGRVVLWDAAHDYARLPALDSGQSVNAVAFSPDGSTLAAAGNDGNVVLWDAAHAYAKPTALDSGQSGVNAVAFSPDGSTLAAAGNDGEVVLWDAAHAYARLPALDSGQSGVSGVAFNPDGSTLAAAGNDGRVVLWDAAHAYARLPALDSGQSGVNAVAFSPDGSTLAAAGNDGNVVLWDAAHDYAKLTALDSGQSGVNAVAFSPDGSTLAAAGADGEVVLWDAAHAYAKPTALDSGQSGISGVAFSPDGSTLAAVGLRVVLWDAAHDYARLPALDSGQGGVNAVAFSPDGSTLAAAGNDGEVVLWDAAHDYARLPALDSGQSGVNAVAFSPDGSTLAAAGEDGEVVLWDAAHDYARLPALGGVQSPINAVAFSPDGSTLAAAGLGVVLLDAAHAYARLPALDSGQTAVSGVAFSPDGSTLAAAGNDGKVVLWDAAHAYARLPALDSGQSGVNGVAFSPDGSTLAAAGNDGKVVLWDFFWQSFSGLRAKVCSLVHGNLTRAEWETLAPGLPYTTTCPD